MVNRPQWIVLIGLVAVALLVAGMCAFAGLWVGQGFENVGPDRGGSLAWWVAAGISCATPVACLPVMRFPVRRKVALLVAAGVAAGIAAAGFLYTLAL